MSIKQFISMAVVMIFCFSAINAFSQGEEQESQLFVVWDIPVHPSMAADFEANAAKEAALYAKYKFPYSYSVFATGEYDYYYVIQLENFSEVDDLYKAFGDLREAAGDELEELSKNDLGSFDFYHMRFFWSMPELSYIPENPDPEYDGYMFREWNFAYINPGKNEEFEDLGKQWVALHKSKNIPRGYDMFRGDAGMDLPVYFWVMSGKNTADFYRLFREDFTALEEEAVALWEKTEKLMRKYEYKTGYLMMELSYVVEE